jgi:hypothetical protein
MVSSSDTRLAVLKAGKGGEVTVECLVDHGPATLDAGPLGHADGSPCGVREVNVVASAARAHVHDLSIDRLAAVLDADLLSAPFVGGLAGHGVVGGSTPGRGSESDVHVGGLHRLTASTESAVERVDGQVDAGEALAGGLGRAGGLLSGGSSGSGGSSRSSRGDGNRSVGSLSGGWRSWGRSSRRGLDRLGSRRGGRDNDRGGGRSRSGSLNNGRSINAGGLRGRSVGGSRGSSRGGGSSGLGGLLVEVAAGSGGGLSDGLVVPDGGVDDYSLVGDLSLGDEVALEGGRSGHGAEKGRNENLRVLHIVGGEFAG